MKAKPSKMKTAAKATASKPASKKPVAVKAAKPAAGKAVAAKPKPAVKLAPKAVAKPAPKPPQKAAPKAPVKVVPKLGKVVVPKLGKVVVPKFGKPPAKVAEVPRPKPRRAPRPASVAVRRKERHHFRELLLKKRQDLMKAYMTSKGDSQSALDNGTEDYVDYAVNSYAREFLLSLTELDRKHLLLVEDALARIDRGEYGYCQQCGEDIPAKRLEVQPWARHCVRCQELEEKGLLPQHTFASGDEDDASDEAEEPAAIDEDTEPEAEVEEELLDDEPLVADGEDSDD